MTSRPRIAKRLCRTKTLAPKNGHLTNCVGERSAKAEREASWCFGRSAEKPCGWSPHGGLEGEPEYEHPKIQNRAGRSRLAVRSPQRDRSGFSERETGQNTYGSADHRPRKNQGYQYSAPLNRYRTRKNAGESPRDRLSDFHSNADS